MSDAAWHRRLPEASVCLGCRRVVLPDDPPCRHAERYPGVAVARASHRKTWSAAVWRGPESAVRRAVTYIGERSQAAVYAEDLLLYPAQILERVCREADGPHGAACTMERPRGPSHRGRVVPRTRIPSLVEEGAERIAFSVDIATSLLTAGAVLLRLGFTAGFDVVAKDGARVTIPRGPIALETPVGRRFRSDLWPPPMLPVVAALWPKQSTRARVLFPDLFIERWLREDDDVEVSPGRPGLTYRDDHGHDIPFVSMKRRWWMF
ncbi:MAG: hypothetical protein AAF928_10980 [Myxococcota bacterium]